MAQQIETVSGGKRVLVCPTCRDTITDDQAAELRRTDEGTIVLEHAGCVPPEDDPEKLVHYGVGT